MLKVVGRIRSFDVRVFRVITVLKVVGRIRSFDV